MVLSAPVSAPPVLALDGVCKRYGAGAARRTVVDGVSLGVARGEAIALVGASGSGKSTLARIALRLERPDAGRVLLDGVDARRVPLRRYRRRVQLVFQDPFASLNPVHTVFHHIARPLLRHGRASPSDVRARALALLARVGLDADGPDGGLLDVYPSRLSGGQRQRVAIARALAPAPGVLVADEPTSMLDVSLRLGVLDLLAALRRDDGLALVYITHDLASARYLADRIAVLHEGHIVEAGPAARVIDAPEHAYTRRLVAAARRPLTDPEASP